MSEHVRLTKIVINNYRSCIETSLEPNIGLSALIGPNGSGKTNILSAFQLLSALGSSRHIGHSRSTTNSEAFSSDCVLKVWFTWKGKPIIYQAQISLVNNEKNQDEILNAVENWYMFSITGSRKKINIPIGVLNDDFRYPRGRSLRDSLVEYLSTQYTSEANAVGAVECLQDLLKFVRSISYYSASIFTNPSNCPISFEVESESGARRGISISGHKKFLFDLYSAYKSETPEFSLFIDLVGANGVNLIDDLSFNEIETSSSVYKVSVGGRITTKEKKNNLIIPNFLISGNALSPSQLSEGTFKTLALIFYLISDHGSLMLIEEPEVCVHHGLLSSIIELIKIYANDKQIIISTHSDQLLDSLKIESVFKVTRDEEGTTVSNIKKSLSIEELRSLKYYLQNEGGLGEYWKHGEL
ncbi:Predicted ATPase [Pseudomonas sp. NFACC49-2]|uniref:AAA family ATPase n=1 Tax=Pseudomonas sp. NFACC49-2 TaxID=1566222 RepID=UPI00091E54B2|nr:ATP-binding protein [Pseudomonas sp. NFACC49-2]SFY08127.1 Predicted ATPase [Pseudomonas sp. NFACC49-2]